MPLRSRDAAMAGRRDAAAYEMALQGLLPSRAHGLLLAACLLESAAASRAWAAFAAEVRDVKAYFEADQMGLKGLLPFVESSLNTKGIDAGKAFHTYARVALVREELRSKIYGEILAEVLGALEAARIPVVLVKGGALSATVYPQPSMRHNHAIDLLVEPAHMAAAGTVLSQVKFKRRAAEAYGDAFHRDFRHTSGLALGLHSQLFFLPHFAMPMNDIRARTRQFQIGAQRVSVLSPEDSLVHVCGHAAYSRARANLRWACDAYFLLQKNPAFDWRIVADTAAAARVTLPVVVLLRWLNAFLGAPLPAERLAELEARSRTIDAVTAEGLYAAMLHTTFSRATAFKSFAASPRAQWGFLKFSAMPSLRYMRWKHNVEHGWKLPLYYADRPRRLALRVARWVLRKGPPGGALETEISTKRGAA
jgi:hypothetical protein